MITHTIINLARLRQVDKPLAYAVAYGREDLLQERIDEEGCGPVIAAARWGI